MKRPVARAEVIGADRVLPARCRATSRRQQVLPDPHPISRGSICHGRPPRGTNKMPMHEALLAELGLPEICQGPIRDCGRMTGNAEVISSPVGLVPRNALAVTVVLLARCRHHSTNPAVGAG
jgi:hypothetical protein